MNKYNFEMEKLFDEWKTREHHSEKIFNKDGIVCPELWNEGDNNAPGTDLFAQGF